MFVIARHLTFRQIADRVDPNPTEAMIRLFRPFLNIVGRAAPSRLVLHVGTHKTGTTTLQKTFAANRDWLRRNDVRYPVFSDGGDSHNAFGLALAEPNPNMTGLAEALAAWREPGATTLVSAEVFSTRIADQPQADFLAFTVPDHAERKRAYLDRLAALAEGFDEVEVLLVLRRPEDYAETLYSTCVLGAKVDCNFSTFLTATAPIYDYKAQVAAFRERFPAVRVASYHALSRRLVEDFCGWAGLPLPPLRERYDNPTPDLRLVLWVQRQALIERDRLRQRRRARFARYWNAASLLPPLDRATVWPSQEARDAFIAAATTPSEDFFPQPAPFGRPVATLDSAEAARLEAAFQDWERRPRRGAAAASCSA